MDQRSYLPEKMRDMSIQEMKKYLELCLQGEATIVSRKMLARKQEELRASIKELGQHFPYRLEANFLRRSFPANVHM